MKVVPFTQYIRPFGTPKSVSIEMDDVVGSKAELFISRGGKFECEVLQGGTVSFTAVFDEEDVAIELSSNNQEVIGKVKQLINTAYTQITKNTPELLKV